MDLQAIISGLMELLPGMLVQLGRWLYDWQVLLAGILALVAAHFWGRAVIRAAELRAGVPGPPKRATRTRRSPPLSVPALRDLRTTVEPKEQAPAPAPALGAGDELARLRATIRGVLARVPCVDDPLTAAQVLQCKSVGNFFLDAEKFKNDGLIRSGFDTLRHELAVLSGLTERATGRTAWQTLIAINNHVRVLELKLAKASAKSVAGV